MLKLLTNVLNLDVAPKPNNNETPTEFKDKDAPKG